MRYATIGILILLAGPDLVTAQQPPGLGYAYPPVVKAGQANRIALGGYDFTDDMQFLTHEDSVMITPLSAPGTFFVPEPPYWFGPKAMSTALPIPREIAARVEVGADTPPGRFAWQVANANGASTAALMMVSDIREVMEDRWRDEAQRIDALPVGISGRIERIAEIDTYEITASRDGPLSVELFARRLGSKFHGLLQVRDPSGRVLVDGADTAGNDLAVTFHATQGERYTVRLHDVDFGGHRSYVYRLDVREAPRVVGLIPANGQRGATREVVFVGYGLASGQARLESLTQTLTFPQDPTQHILRYRLETPFGTTAPIEIPLSDRPELSERPERIEKSIALTRTLSSPEGDLVPGRGLKRQRWQFAAESRTADRPLDLQLEILDADGKRLAHIDDVGNSMNPRLEWNVPQDGPWTVRVTDVSGRSGMADAIYRLTALVDEPGFRLGVPQRIALSPGGKASVPITLERRGGFNEEVSLAFTGLPPHIEVAEPLKIPAGKKTVKLSLQAAQDAPAQACFVGLTGRAMIGGTEVVETARGPHGGSQTTDPVASMSKRILLTTTLSPPFSLELVDKNRQRAVHRGTTYPAEFVVNRNEGFRGPVLLQMLAQQGRHRQGIHSPIITASPSQQRVLYPTFLPEWLETDRTTRMSVLGLAQVEDPQGNRRWVAGKADARITMILEGALLKVAHEAGELTVVPGDNFDIPVRIARSAKLKGVVTVSARFPRELASCLSADTIELAPGEEQARLVIKTRPAPELRNRWKIQLVATARQDGRWPVRSQTEVDVEFAPASRNRTDSERQAPACGAD